MNNWHSIRHFIRYSLEFRLAFLCDIYLIWRSIATLRLHPKQGWQTWAFLELFVSSSSYVRLFQVVRKTQDVANVANVNEFRWHNMAQLSEFDDFPMHFTRRARGIFMVLVDWFEVRGKSQQETSQTFPWYMDWFKVKDGKPSRFL